MSQAPAEASDTAAAPRVSRAVTVNAGCAKALLTLSPHSGGISVLL